MCRYYDNNITRFYVNKMNNNEPFARRCHRSTSCKCCNSRPTEISASRTNTYLGNPNSLDKWTQRYLNRRCWTSCRTKVRFARWTNASFDEKTTKNYKRYRRNFERQIIQQKLLIFNCHGFNGSERRFTNYNTTTHKV